MSLPADGRAGSAAARARELADGVSPSAPRAGTPREEYPWDNVKDLVAAGFMGLDHPGRVRRGGRPLLDVVLVVEEIARACGVTGAHRRRGQPRRGGRARRLRHRGAEAPLLPVGAGGRQAGHRHHRARGGLGGHRYDDPRRRDADGLRAAPARSAGSPAPGPRGSTSSTAASAAAPGADGIGGIFVERDTPGFRIGERDRTMGLRGIPEGGCTSTAAAVPQGARARRARPTASSS